MEISNPRRILAVSLADSAHHLSDVIKDLTGTTPSSSSAPEASTLAGTTHPLPLVTAYYTATIPIWLDLISTSSSSSSSPSSPADWSATFLSPEAKEVLAVLGGVLVVFALPPPPPPPPSSSTTPPPVSRETPDSTAEQPRREGQGDDGREQARELVKQVGRVVREGLGGWEWDGVAVAVGVSNTASMGAGDGDELDEWEDLCGEAGLEFVHVSKAAAARAGGGGEEKGGERNEFGERMGVARVLEALQANDWSGADGDEDDEEEEDETSKGKGQRGQDEEEDGEFDPESLDFGFDREDFVGLKKAIWGGGGDGEGSKGEGGEKDDELGDEDVQKLERMMLKLQAVRDATAGLPEEQRKRMAKRVVGEVMKEL